MRATTKAPTDMQQATFCLWWYMIFFSKTARREQLNVFFVLQKIGIKVSEPMITLVNNFCFCFFLIRITSRVCNYARQ